MAAKKGHKKAGGRTKGTPNKRTLQWEAFTEYCLVGGLDKFQKELNSLKSKDFVNAFLSLLEYHKPKLARTELTGKDGSNLMQPDLTHLTFDQLYKLANANPGDNKKGSKDSAK